MSPAGPGPPRAAAVDACDCCLRRTDLLARLAPRLEIEWRRARRLARVLALADEALLSLDPSGATAAAYEAFAAAPARDRITAAGLTARCRCAASYPDRLRQLPDPPAVVHVAGDAAALAEPDAVAVVGARRATAYGLEVARGMGRGLSAAGLPVVSGMALGVDSAAHEGALERAGAPVAVLAGGADVAYPARMRGLHARLIERGAVVSEMAPGFRALRWCFVARNRLIAALSEATVVVEAAARSGSLTSADFAAELGRTVAAVPGPVTSPLSAGTNGLIAAGAALATGAGDVVELLGRPPVHEREPDRVDDPLARRLLESIEGGRCTLGDLAPDLDRQREVLAALTELELRGLIRRTFGGRWMRVA